MSRRALFLDRDGVINIDHAYVCQPEHFEFVDGIFELCRTAKQLGYLIFVVTNQAGIGRGFYTEQDFLELSDWMYEDV
ncbi:MAG: HAD-IIIA family hydrolase [Methylobacter sp.]|nr:HAD-IIIA family hydrolase [Methylobacter sp.]